MKKRTMIPRTRLLLVILLLLGVPAIWAREKWKPTSTSVPTQRYDHTAVWTRTQMIA